MTWKIRLRKRDLGGVGNGMADPQQGLNIKCPLYWDHCQLQVNFLIDSGATALLLDEKVFECIPEEHRPRLRPVDVQVTLVDGSAQQCRGKVPFRIGICDSSQPVEFFVGRTRQF